MSNDRDHFDEYRDQTLVKHTILEKYLFAYFNILKNSGEKNLVYIDGFAGRGTYGEGATKSPGSPLRALEKIAANADLAPLVSTAFIEKDGVLFAELKASVSSFFAGHGNIREPQCVQGEFAAEMTTFLDGLEQAGKRIAPVFVFIDPCGVDGVDFDVIKRILRSQEKAEIFLFFNIDGVRRILGLKEKMGPTAGRVFGGDDRAKKLAEQVASTEVPSERERIIITAYEELLRISTPAKYVVSFRIEKEDRRTAAHYLVHASQHPLGFSIMKDVMWSAGKTAEGKGGLEFQQASIGSMQMLFNPEWDALKSSVVKELEAGPRPVTHFYETLVARPDNRLCEAAYRAALLELERDGRIVVLAKDGITPAPKRKTRNGAATLGESYFVKLP